MASLLCPKFEQPQKSLARLSQRVHVRVAVVLNDDGEEGGGGGGGMIGRRSPPPLSLSLALSSCPLLPNSNL